MPTPIFYYHSSLSSVTSPTFSASLENHAGSVCAYDEERLIMQHDFMHLSFPQDGLKEFVETLVVALRTNGKAMGGAEVGI